MEVVEESLKDMDVSLYQDFRKEGGTTLNEIIGREWRRNLGTWPLKGHDLSQIFSKVTKNIKPLFQFIFLNEKLTTVNQISCQI